MRCAAPREAINYLTKALALSERLPEGQERDRLELMLRVMLGVPLSATQGYAAPEVEQTYTRALTLCRRVGDPTGLFSALHGLGIFYGVRADPQTAREVLDQLYRHAEEQHDPALMLEASWGKGAMLVYRGELDPARHLLEQGLSLYNPRQHGSHAYMYGQDPGVACLSYLAWVSLIMGEPDLAVRRCEEALALAHELGHPFTLAWALHYVVLTHQQRKDSLQVSRHLQQLSAFATEQEFPFWMAMATITNGGELLRGEQITEGATAIERGLVLHRALGAEIGSTYWLGLLAEAYGKQGLVEKGMQAFDEASTLVKDGREMLWEAELHRLKGELLLGALAPEPQRPKVSRNVENDAVACFRQAIDVAQRQRAKLWALRAATSLARLWKKQRKSKQARDLLVPLYDSFTEGFDAPDLQEAAAVCALLRNG